MLSSVVSTAVTEGLESHAVHSRNNSISALKPPPIAGGMRHTHAQQQAIELDELVKHANFNLQPRPSRKPRTLNITQTATCGPAFGRAVSPFLASNATAGGLSNGTSVISASPNDGTVLDDGVDNGFGVKEFRDSYRLTRRRKLELTRSQLPECLHNSFLPNDDRVMLEELQDEEKLREIMKETGILTIRGTSYAAHIEDLEHVGEVGHGVCGTVVKMRFKKTGDVIAVKQMRRSGNREENKRIIRDLEVILKSNDCPHIVQCYGCFVTEAEVWICMELMTSCMEKLLHRTRRLYADDPTRGIPEPIIGTMSLAVVKALHYLKEKHGVIHRDVKPSNILVDARTGRFKLCDFGISGRLVDSKAKTRTAGCAAYMAPERISPPDPKKPDYDIRADVWSFGISLYELATGSMPYKGCQGDFEVLTKIIEDDPPLLSPDDGFSIPFCSFLQACLTKDHKHRPKYHELLQHPFIRLYELKKIDIFDFLRSVTSNTQFLYQQQEMLLKPSVQQQSPTVTPQLPGMPLYHRMNRQAAPLQQPPHAVKTFAIGSHADGDLMPPPILPPKNTMRHVAVPAAPFVLAQPPRLPKQVIMPVDADVAGQRTNNIPSHWSSVGYSTADRLPMPHQHSMPTNVYNHSLIISLPHAAASTPSASSISSASPASMTSASSSTISQNSASNANILSPFSPSNIYELIRHRYWPHQQQQPQQQPQQQQQRPAVSAVRTQQHEQSTTSYYDWLQSTSAPQHPHSTNVPVILAGVSDRVVATGGYVPFGSAPAAAGARYTAATGIVDDRCDETITLPNTKSTDSMSAKLASLFIHSSAQQQQLMLQKLQRLPPQQQPHAAYISSSLSRPTKHAIMPSSTSSSPGMLPYAGGRTAMRELNQRGSSNVSAVGNARSISASRAHGFGDNSSKFSGNYAAHQNNELTLLHGLNEKAAQLAAASIRTTSLQDHYSSARRQQQQTATYRPRNNTYGYSGSSAGYHSSSLTSPRQLQQQVDSGGVDRHRTNRSSASVDRLGGSGGRRSSAIVNNNYAIGDYEDF